MATLNHTSNSELTAEQFVRRAFGGLVLLGIIFVPVIADFIPRTPNTILAEPSPPYPVQPRSTDLVAVEACYRAASTRMVNPTEHSRGTATAMPWPFEDGVIDVRDQLTALSGFASGAWLPHTYSCRYNALRRRVPR